MTHDPCFQCDYTGTQYAVLPCEFRRKAPKQIRGEK